MGGGGGSRLWNRLDGPVEKPLLDLHTHCLALLGEFLLQLLRRVGASWGKNFVDKIPFVQFVFVEQFHRQFVSIPQVILQVPPPLQQKFITAAFVLHDHMIVVTCDKFRDDLEQLSDEEFDQLSVALALLLCQSVLSHGDVALAFDALLVETALEGGQLLVEERLELVVQGRLEQLNVEVIVEFLSDVAARRFEVVVQQVHDLPPCLEDLVVHVLFLRVEVE
mmetsp:Transcript_3512/g.7270  ORF Transcript_3512/g.7270 Transcript_3512/m.7270 type:complete len:222 (-) Transcript_3512:222-887(-)